MLPVEIGSAIRKSTIYGHEFTYDALKKAAGQ
jgi:hypothetical protein